MDDEPDSAASGDEKSDGHEGDDIVTEAASGAGDTRRIRSFENGGGGIGKWFDRRKSISDRLASISALAGSKVRLFLFEFMGISNILITGFDK